MPKFRKRPVTIDAEPIKKEILIETLAGKVLGRKGDWLLTGVNGEQYPCTDEIFRKTYEPVDDEAFEFFEGTENIDAYEREKYMCRESTKTISKDARFPKEIGRKLKLIREGKCPKDVVRHCGGLRWIERGKWDEETENE